MGARGIGKGDSTTLSALFPDPLEQNVRDISVLSVPKERH